MAMAYPGLGFDPTPGEAGAVDGALTSIGRGRRQVDGCSTDLRTALRTGGWAGPAAAAYRSATAGLPGALADAGSSLDRATHALETWLKRLLDNQREASRLDARATVLRGSPELAGELRRTIDAARRLRSRHLRQAAAAAAALRAGVWVWVWDGAADGAAVAAGQVSGWTGQVAWLGAPPVAGALPADGMPPLDDALLSDDPLPIDKTDATSAAGAVGPLPGTHTEMPEIPGVRTSPVTVRVDLPGGRVVDLPTAAASVRTAAPAVRRPRATSEVPSTRAHPVEDRRDTGGSRRSASVAPPRPTAGPPPPPSRPHLSRPAPPVPGVVSDLPRTPVGATPTPNNPPESVDQHVQASAVTVEDSAPAGRPAPAVPGIAAATPSTGDLASGPGRPGSAPIAPGGPLEPGRVTSAEPGYRPTTTPAAGAPAQATTRPVEVEPEDAAFLIAAAGLPVPTEPDPVVDTPVFRLGTYLVCCGTTQLLVLAEERGDTVRRTMFLSAS